MFKTNTFIVVVFITENNNTNIKENYISQNKAFNK